MISSPQRSEALAVATFRPRRFLIVDGFGSWFVTAVKTKRRARQLGVEEFGRGWVKGVNIATAEQVAEYCRCKGLTEDQLTNDGDIED